MQGTTASREVDAQPRLSRDEHRLLESLTAEPGFGLVTLRPHPEPGDNRCEVIIPIGSIVRITLRPPEEKPGFGFSLPAE